MRSPAETAALDTRLPGETPVAQMLRGIVASFILGLEESGIPLTAEQVTFLTDAVTSLRCDCKRHVDGSACCTCLCPDSRHGSP